MNIDGDGRNALGTVHNLITMNGGLVDAEQDGAKCNGEIKPSTRYLVTGDEPNAKASQEDVRVFTRMVADADRLGVRKMSLTELKQKMGYKKSGAVERFGHGDSAPENHKSAASSGSNGKAAAGSGSTGKRRPTPKAAAAATDDM
jgi:hypothetical protein